MIVDYFDLLAGFQLGTPRGLSFALLLLIILRGIAGRHHLVILGRALVRQLRLG